MLGPKYMPGLSTKQRLVIFTKYYCLGFVNPTTKEFVCAVRTPTGLNYPDNQKGKNANPTVTYPIPYPGTYAVIMFPDEDLYESIANAKSGDVFAAQAPAAAASLENKTQYLIILLLAVIFFMICLVFIKDVGSHVSMSRIMNLCGAYKWTIVKATTMDFSGQGVINKLTETVRYFENPLLFAGAKNDAYAKLNIDIEAAKELEMDKLLHSTKVAREATYLNNELRDLKKIDKADPNNLFNKEFEIGNDSNYTFHKFTRSPWAILQTRKMRMLGVSVYGGDAIEEIDMESAPDGGEDGGEVVDGPQAEIELQDVPADVEVEVEVDAAPAEVEIEVGVDAPDIEVEVDANADVEVEVDAPADVEVEVEVDAEVEL